MTGEVARVRALARKAGLDVTIVHAGVAAKDARIQYRITGPHLTVDWWPYSKNKTAYVVNTARGVLHATPEELIEMARTPPPAGVRAQRVQSRARSWKHRQYRRLEKQGKGKRIPCHWCGKHLTASKATVDHRIPLHRGGLDNHNNFVISCEPCNQKRGHNMPEVTP